MSEETDFNRYFLVKKKKHLLLNTFSPKEEETKWTTGMPDGKQKEKRGRVDDKVGTRDHEREGNSRRKGGEEKRREKYNGEGKKGEETKKKSGEPAARNELEVNQTYRSYCSRYHYHLLPNYYLQQLYIWTLCLVFLIRCTASDVPEQRNHLRSIYLSRVARCFLLVATWYIRFLSGIKSALRETTLLWNASLRGTRSNFSISWIGNTRNGII